MNGIMNYCYGSNCVEQNCDVIIHDKTISVSYFEGHKWVVYKGTEISPGHYELYSDNGRASLHCFPKGSRFVGIWEEGHIKGFWDIVVNAKEKHDEEEHH